MMKAYKINIMTIMALFVVGCGDLLKPYENENYNATLSVEVGCNLLNTDSLKIGKTIANISDTTLAQYADTLNFVHSDSNSVLYTDIENNWQFTAETDTVLIGLFISSTQSFSFYIDQTSQINIFNEGGTLIEKISENIELETVASCPTIRSIFEFHDLNGSYLISFIPSTIGTVSMAVVSD